MKTKRFYLKITSGKKVVYKNENGKIVSKKSVLKGKRKIIETDKNESIKILQERNFPTGLKDLPSKNSVIEFNDKGRKRYVNSEGKRINKKDLKKEKILEVVGSGKLKGKTIPKKIQVKTKKTKIPVKGKSISFGLLNINVIGEFTLALERSFKVYVKNSDINEILQLYSKSSQANFLLFFTKINKKFYELFKKISEYPFFEISLIENKKEKKSIFDFTELSYKSKGKENEKIQKTFQDFQQYVKVEFFNTFQ